MTDDQRLIEDLIPIDVINAAAQGEERGNLGDHPRRLHRWWARRPLAAARAVVYATVVRASDVPADLRSTDFFAALCSWTGSEAAIAEARANILSSNGGAPPTVLDMFAGGGAIPLEAARLGCRAVAVELNPVAHLIQKATLEYPQRFGPSLADDIRTWGERWLEEAWARTGHLYPPVEDVERSDEVPLFSSEQTDGSVASPKRAAGRPIAYVWTRTVPCPNPALGAHHAPLMSQTWLAKKNNRNIALRPRVDRQALTIEWEVVEATTVEGLGFDPAGFSSGSSTSCVLCGAHLSGNYVRDMARRGECRLAPLAAVVLKPSGRGRDYKAVGGYPLPNEEDCRAVLDSLDVLPPDEPIPPTGNAGLATGRVHLYGMTRFRDLCTPRQLATLCALAQGVGEQHAAMIAGGMDAERARAVALYLGLAMSRTVDFATTLCIWHKRDESLQNTYRLKSLIMVWDFVESNPFADAAGGLGLYLRNTAGIVEALSASTSRSVVHRASATNLAIEPETVDAVITDPPYYDSLSYADLSDFFYVWLKRSVGALFPDDLSGWLAPRRHEAIVAAYRHQDGAEGARVFYEELIARSFAEAHRVLKAGAPLVVVYAHKTTLGWSTLVDALRTARFRITEAWPLDTEMTTGVKTGTSSLASSIFLVARKRDTEKVGDLVEVRRDLESLIAARLKRLADAGVNGADLVIATMGAALEPYTRYASVELPNGEELPASVFLEEVQRRVLGAILKQIHGLDEGVDAVDAATRYYVLARYSYGYAPVDYDEANNLARSANIELADLEGGVTPLATVKKGSVTLHDYSERGADEELGLPGANLSRPLIDVLHGLLWRSAHAPRDIRAYLDSALPDPVALRLVAQALQGRALRGEDDATNKHREQQACERLLGAWNTLVEDNLLRMP